MSHISCLRSQAGNHQGVQVKGAFNAQTPRNFGLKDPQTRVLYLFLVGCQADCYESNQDTIDEVVSSWTIKER